MVAGVKWKVDSTLKISVLLCCFYESLCFTHSTHCSHRPPKPDEVLHHVHLESAHVVKKRSITQPLRIKLFYDNSVYRLPKEKFDMINNTILPQAVDYWQKALFVRPMSVPIRLNRKCPKNQAFFPEQDRKQQYCVEYCENVTTCGEVVVPEEHLEWCRICNAAGHHCRLQYHQKQKGEGIRDADFVFYVSAMETDRCYKGQTVAYASHCQQEMALDRPIAGHANLCPNSISTKSQDLDTLLSTVKHEILHALGFSVSLYAYFRDKNGNPLTHRGSNGKPQVNKELQAHQWSDRIIKKIIRPDWKVRGGNIRKELWMMVTPRVVEEARKHFNCPYLEGAELEDQGENGTWLTHWEKRLFENEAMTGTHTQNPVYSHITLALMEDTGWYAPNYQMAQQFDWGKNLGCDFATKSCKHWIDVRRTRGWSIHPYCDKVKRDPLETECTDSRDAVALCNLVQYDRPLRHEFQNFDYIPGIPDEDVGKYGGSVVLADYCPYVQEFTWQSNDVAVRGSRCQYGENTPVPEKNFALEYYGPSSKCFNHNKEMWVERTCQQERHWQHWGSGCYQYHCYGGRLHVEVANKTYTCYQEGQNIKIQRYVNGWLHIGTLLCPSCDELCNRLGMKCKPEIIKAASFSSNDKHYFKDILICGSSSVELFNLRTLITLVLVVMCITR